MKASRLQPMAATLVVALLGATGPAFALRQERVPASEIAAGLEEQPRSEDTDWPTKSGVHALPPTPISILLTTIQAWLERQNNPEVVRAEALNDAIKDLVSQPWYQPVHLISAMGMLGYTQEVDHKAGGTSGVATIWRRTGLEEAVEIIAPAEARKMLQALMLPNPVGVLGQWVFKDSTYQLNRLIYREADPSPYSWSLGFEPGSVDMRLPRQAATPSGADTSYLIQIPPDQLLALVQQAVKITRTTVPGSYTPSAADTSFTKTPSEFHPSGGESQYTGLEEKLGEGTTTSVDVPDVKEELVATIPAAIYTLPELQAPLIAMLTAAERSGEPEGVRNNTFAVESVTKLSSSPNPAPRSIVVVTHTEWNAWHAQLQPKGLAVVAYQPA